ncbi:MAG: hypothetical protein HYZ92_01465 [Candidatus Omnitrophica bacterium]|nr:hypothetical protein [Candidatus Omnitrophota bacterium]
MIRLSKSAALRRFAALSVICCFGSISSLYAEDRVSARSEEAIQKKFELWELELLPEKTLKELDVNRDGLVDKDTEWRGAPVLFDLKDQNRDGVISKDETELLLGGGPL